MGKVGKARKRARRSQELNSGRGDDGGDSSVGVEPTEPDAPLDVEALRTTEQTLRLLLESPNGLLRSSQARIIRSQVFAIVEALGGTTSGGGFAKSLTGRIGDALHDGRWGDAIELLQTNDISPPPLGALQRWIRDLFENSKCCSADTSCHVLSLVLQSTGQGPAGQCDEEVGLPGPRKVFPLWFATPRVPITVEVDDADWIEPDVVPVAMEAAWKDGMTLWTTNGYQSSPVSLILHKSATLAVTTTRTNVPFVPGAFVLNHVLSTHECRRILKVAHRMGFTPEASYSAPSAASTLATACTLPTSVAAAATTAADGVVWIVDDATLTELVARVSPLLPPEVCGGKLVGINARWRIYHYKVGTVYRPHIDGAWTGSGLVDGVYVQDIYAPASVTSRLTFLIYLNDDFDNGGTTFYAPSHEEKCIAARSVAPIQGSILCFPHGHGVPNVGLVHEGSAVTKGSKYVMRSDVLYQVPVGSRPTA